METITPPASEPWSVHAARWNRLGSPLRPGAEDLERLHRAWLESLPAGIPDRSLDILAFGVTPEIALFPWAPKFQLTALDASVEMIRTVWPGDGPNRQAVLGHWQRTPFADASFDLIVCDAGLTPLMGEEKLTSLGREMRRLLRPDGRVAMRHLARTEPAETKESIQRAINTGRLRNFHELKLRLLLAVEAETLGDGVRLGDVHDAFQRLFPDRASLANQLGCDLQIIETIDAYRGQDARYGFPTLAELARFFGDFELMPGPPGHYPAAELCPVFSLTPKI